MSNWLEKWRGGDTALTPERRAMEQALARLEKVQAPDPQAEAQAAGRLAFVLDLTGSRRASLLNARIATAAMFDTVKAIGAIAVKLIYYRGTSECKAGPWEVDPAAVSRVMQRLSCVTGTTQIARALRHVLGEEEHLAGVVFIGDHCEDDPDELAQLAAALGQRRIPVFVFHECQDGDIRAHDAKSVFQSLAEVSGGVYCEFQPGSGAVLNELLSTLGAFSVAWQQGVKEVGPATTPQARQLQERLLLLPGASTGPGSPERRKSRRAV